MFIVTAKVPKRRCFVLFALLPLAALAVFLALRGGTDAGKDAEAPERIDTNESRVAYLTALGWAVEPEPIESLRVTLPAELEEPYRSYNTLQLRQGFDLTPFLGETLERWTYAVTNHPAAPRFCQADLYLYDGAVVAGDIVCTGADGFIATLEFPTDS
ncbi:MAG: DUF4830 domain-containing protein [Ruminococcaceae bacterium]|nr:DUF4830 domain-containing protein [Oscillospiraceae bacterium]